MKARALGLAVTLAWTFGLRAQQSELDQEPAFGTTVVLPAGLHGTIYALAKETYVLPDFDHDDIGRIGDIWANALNVPPRHWHAGFPGLSNRFEWFAIDYNGRFWVETPGRYTFALLSDDGSRLYIDGTPVIDDDCRHPPEVRTAAVALEGGGHTIRVSYFQGPRDCLALVLAVAVAGGQWRVFDVRDFTPPSNPQDWRFPEKSKMAIVPVTPQEASLTASRLLDVLGGSDARERNAIKTSPGRGCFWDPTVTCAP